jgi:hypothetical protein
MSIETTPRRAITERLIKIPGGEIVLRDEGTKTSRKAEVGAFQATPDPVTRRGCGW